ncbi:MAG: xanthine dehydrogenase family protein molybdopterin-binding subunit [Cyclobacteriaceae bacterium]
MNSSRRAFLKQAGIGGSALILGITGMSTSHPVVKKFTFEGLDALGLNDFIFINPAGKITLVNHRPEMGQGVYQSMPSLLAEELEVSMDEIHIVQAKASEIKYDHQLVGGSGSVRKSWTPSRKMGAAAREMLVKAAAEQWGVSVSQCAAKNGKVHCQGKSLTYGELVQAASKLPVPENPKLKAKKDFNILGKSLIRKDAPLKTNGTAEFGLDLEIPGMVYATIERSPVFHGKVKSFNRDELLTLPGITEVVKSEMPVFSHIREGVAIIGTSYYHVLKAREQLKVSWDDTGIELVNQSEIEDLFQNLADQTPQFIDESHGDYHTSMEAADKVMDLTYKAPYQSHATMEPMNCVVQVKSDQCTFWGPIQSPNWIRNTLAEELKMDIEAVEVNVSFLGGGFGRRAFNDYGLEAAFLSKKLNGLPVKVVWKREDDNTQGPFRPATLSRMQAGLKDGNLTGLSHYLVTQMMGFQNPGVDKAEKPQWVMEGINVAYEVPNWQNVMTHAELPIPVMWWRSVYASTVSFGHESFIDEVAIELKQDPFQFRRSLLTKSPRYLKVLDKLEEVSDWKQNRSNKGMAIVHSFGSICAHVVEMSRNDERKLVVKKVYSVIDCGMTVNQDTVKAQTEGNVIMAMTAAFKSEITFEKGQAMQQNFHQYAMLRIDETPDIEVHIMENDEDPGGVGEPGLPPLAPALTNAIYAATGKRIRKLPFDLNAL